MQQELILRRLNQLERRCRLLSAALLGLVVLVGITVVLAAEPKKPEVLNEIRVKKLVIVDEKGIGRIELGAGEDDRDTFVGARFFDPDGMERIVLKTRDKIKTANLMFFDGRKHIKLEEWTTVDKGFGRLPK